MYFPILCLILVNFNRKTWAFYIFFFFQITNYLFIHFQFRSQGERTLIFCEMPEMLELLRNYLHLHQVSFAYLDAHANIKERLTILEDFMTRRNFMALLTSPEAAVQVSSKPSLKIGSVNKAFLFWYWLRPKKYFF